MSRDDAPTLLTVAQAATILGVHPNTIRTWTDAGRLTAYRINSRGDRRFRRGDVERLLVEDRPADDDPIPKRDAPQERSGELAVFGRIAAGLASSPTTASVARAVVEALRTELGVDRAAIYVSEVEPFELAAHAGFDEPPPISRAVDADAPDVGDRAFHEARTDRPARARRSFGRQAVGRIPALAGVDGGDDAGEHEAPRPGQA